jgi:uncharacterized protein
MLIEFVVENFRSFKEETVFSLIATKDESHASHVIHSEGVKPLRVLRAAALYGANASGKSNLINAIAFAREFILKGTRASDEVIPFEPYKLSATTSASPSKFEFIFTLDGTLHTYGFKADASRVHEEWLFTKPRKNETRYFERITDESGKVRVEFGHSLIQKAEQNKSFFSHLAEGTRPTQLFLNEAVERNVAPLKGIMDWFSKALHIIPADSAHIGLAFLAHRDQSFSDFLYKLLVAAGTGITGIKTAAELLDFDRHLPEWPEVNRLNILKTLSENPEGEFASISRNKPFGIVSGLNGKHMFIKILAQHDTEEGEVASFEWEEESDGTRRLINLAPALFDLSQNEHIFLIDEIDRRLHPLLSRLFVQSFLDGTGKGQMVFTTHETNLLDLDLLRRDEIWFVEKNKQGMSHLYSLAEFKIREDLKISKGYLNGRFGAIPFIGDISRLDWTKAEPKA